MPETPPDQTPVYFNPNDHSHIENLESPIDSQPISPRSSIGDEENEDQPKKTLVSNQSPNKSK